MADPICKEGGNTLNGTTIPIIFVPGVMGSRLKFTAIQNYFGQNWYWDPDSVTRMQQWLLRDAETKRVWMHFKNSSASVISDDNDYESLYDGANGTQNEKNRGWPGVAWGFYGEFLRSINTNKQYPVYAVGYDWRQDNALSGRYVTQQILAILQKENQAAQFVLISHSMGGIVTRQALKFGANGTDISSKLLGIIHVVQPATGAAVFYRRLWTGCTRALDGGWAGWPLANIMGGSGADFTTLVSGLPGPVQLMPTNLYKYRGQPWLMHQATGGTPQEYTGDVYGLYNSATMPPGGVDPACTDIVKGEFAARLTEASAFHSNLADYKHDKTWAVYSSGLVTDHTVTAIDLAAGSSPPTNRADNIQMGRQAEGDGTVPGPSAAALFPGQNHNATEILDDNNRQFVVQNVEHSDAFKDPYVQLVVNRFLTHVTGTCFGVSPSAGKDPALDGGVPSGGTTNSDPQDGGVPSGGTT